MKILPSKLQKGHYIIQGLNSPDINGLIELKEEIEEMLNKEMTFNNMDKVHFDN
jgi:hypothetical protein